MLPLKYKIFHPLVPLLTITGPATWISLVTKSLESRSQLKPSLNNASGTTTGLRGVWGIITLDFEQSYKWFEHHTLTQNLKVLGLCVLSLVKYCCRHLELDLVLNSHDMILNLTLTLIIVIQWFQTSTNVLHIMVNQPSKIAHINCWHIVVYNFTCIKTLSHEYCHLLLPIIFSLFHQFLFSLLNPLSQESLLVYHFLALLKLVHHHEFWEHILDPLKAKS